MSKKCWIAMLDISLPEPPRLSWPAAKRRWYVRWRSDRSPNDRCCFMPMNSIFRTLTPLAVLLAGATSYAQDPLPSWNDTAPKKAIVAFVEKVTKQGSPDFVPPDGAHRDVR